MLPKAKELLVPRLRDHDKISGEFGPVERYGLLRFIWSATVAIALICWSIYMLVTGEGIWWLPLPFAVWALIAGRLMLWFYSGR